MSVVVLIYSSQSSIKLGLPAALASIEDSDHTIGPGLNYSAADDWTATTVSH